MSLKNRVTKESFARPIWPFLFVSFLTRRGWQRIKGDKEKEQKDDDRQEKEGDKGKEQDDIEYENKNQRNHKQKRKKSSPHSHSHPRCSSGFPPRSWPLAWPGPWHSVSPPHLLLPLGPDAPFWSSWPLKDSKDAAGTYPFCLLQKEGENTYVYICYHLFFCVYWSIKMVVTDDFSFFF